MRSITFEPMDNGCFKVTFPKAGYRGYPHLYYGKRTNGKPMNAMRYIYVICHGKIPRGKMVRHKCDNKLCVNPLHLELGTHADNHHDAMSRGRNSRGEGHGMHKLSEKDVMSIVDVSIKAKKKGERLLISDIRLGLRYGVHKDIIRKIRTGDSWRHIQREFVRDK